MVKTITEETREPCAWCSGKGQKVTRSGAGVTERTDCPRCTGTGFLLTKTVTRTEAYDLDELAAAVTQRIMDAIQKRAPIHDRPIDRAEPPEAQLPVIQLEDQ